MTFRHVLCISASFAALTGCSDKAEQARPNREASTNELYKLQDYLSTPQYGQAQRISGKVMFGQETSAIGICEGARSACKMPTNLDGSERPCWVEFNEQASADITKITGKTYAENGEYWVEGTGRIAVRPGEFGHLSQYTCQVEMTSVRAFESGPPYFWEPPPPSE